MPRVPGCDAVYEVANQWRDRCLKSDGSLLWPDEQGWTIPTLEETQQLMTDLTIGEFPNLPALLRHRFDEKSAMVRRVGADVFALWFLMIGWIDSKTRMSRVDSIKPEPVDPTMYSLLGQAAATKMGGIGGGNHQTRGGAQLALYLLFARRLKETGISPWDPIACHQLAYELVPEIQYSNQAPNMLLHLLFPDEYEAVTLESEKRLIIKTAGMKPSTPQELDGQMELARLYYQEITGRSEFTFFDQDIHSKWFVKPKASSTEEKPSDLTANVTRRYWKISPGHDAVLWPRFNDESIIALGWSGTPDLTTLNADSPSTLEILLKTIPGVEIHKNSSGYASRQLWAFLDGMSVGDAVVAYGLNKIRGIGTITGEYEFVVSSDDYQHVRDVEWQSTVPKDLSGLPSDLVKKIQQNMTIIELTAKEFAEIIGEAQAFPILPIDDLSIRSHLGISTIQSIEALLRAKKQIILEGPPGSGKTYVARLFARYLAGLPLDGKPDEHVEIVQFHQSYGYEDFVAGIRPITGSNGQLTYETRPGIFLEMCLRAQQHPEETFVLIIDEINRGNLSRVFGELLYGLEYRDQPVRMQYPIEIDGESIQHLTIPDNLYLIGTMNSTDRSLAMIDYALRRRFYFWRLMPTENNTAPVLERWLATQDNISPSDRAQLLATFISLNSEIAATLGSDYQIGHSYFMLNDGQIGDPAARERIWRYAIEPLLREYFHTRRDASDRIAALATGFFAPPIASIELLESDDLDL